MKLCRTLICLGIIIGLPSVWETLAFSWNPLFQAPGLPLGPTHTNYHAFREFTLTIGVENYEQTLHYFATCHSDSGGQS